MILTIKQSVTLSFLWSLSDTFATEKVLKKHDQNGRVIQAVKIYTTKKAPNQFRIACLAECVQLDKATTDIVEDLKIKVWDTMAEQYEGQEMTADIITMIEALFYDNLDWLQQINPNFQRWVDSMTMKMIAPKLDPKFSRKVATQFIQTLNKVLYDGNKD